MRLGRGAGGAVHRKTKRETHGCWLALAGRKATRRARAQPRMPLMRHCVPGSLPRAPQAVPGTRELCAGKDENRVRTLHHLSAGGSGGRSLCRTTPPALALRAACSPAGRKPGGQAAAGAAGSRQGCWPRTPTGPDLSHSLELTLKLRRKSVNLANDTGFMQWSEDGSGVFGGAGAGEADSQLELWRKVMTARTVSEQPAHGQPCGHDCLPLLPSHSCELSSARPPLQTTAPLIPVGCEPSVVAARSTRHTALRSAQ